MRSRPAPHPSCENSRSNGSNQFRDDRVFDDVLRPDIDVQVSHHAESQYLLQKVAYQVRLTDAIERHVYEPVVRAVYTFAGWMRILKAVPGCVLLLYANHAAIERNLRTYAARHGVDPQRLVFAARLGPEEYLARYRTADLFLDTRPYNAGTTASDALFSGGKVARPITNSHDEGMANKGGQ